MNMQDFGSVKLKDLAEHGRKFGFDEAYIPATGRLSGLPVMLEVFDYAKDFTFVETRSRTIRTTPDTVVYVR
jgi:hypothetical protein